MTSLVLRVLADRASVAMGDDVRSHLVAWDLPSDARVGDLVRRVVDEPFLAGVQGDVGWSVAVLHGGEIRRDALGRPVSLTGGDRELLVYVLVPAGPEPARERAQVLPISRSTHARLRLEDAVRPAGTGEYLVDVRYHAGMRPVPYAEFCAEVAETDAAERTRLASRRAQDRPDLYDVDGELRAR